MELRFGPARIPSRESPETAIALLLERGYSACEIDFEGGFWMDYGWAERLGAAARRHSIALSVHAPIAGFLGHVARDKKYRMAVGMLDHSAGIAAACGAELVVFHPGFLLGRERRAALDALVEQLGHGQFEQEDLFGEDDRVLVRWVAHGELRAPWLGLPATGQPLALRGLNIFRVQDGRIVERWSYIDLADVLRQVGKSGAQPT